MSGCDLATNELVVQLVGIGLGIESRLSVIYPLWPSWREKTLETEEEL